MADEPFDPSKLTPDQLDIAQAQARARAQKALTDKQAADASQGGGFWSSVGGALGDAGKFALGEAGSFAHGLGAGLAAIPDVAAAGGAGILNIPRRIENSGGWGVLADTSAPEKQQPLIVAPPAVEELYNRYVPPITGYEHSVGERIGQVVAPLVLTGGVGGLPELAAMGGRELATTGANLLGRSAVTAGGAAVGQDIGHSVGSSIDQLTGGTAGRDYGDVIGSMIGGGAAPDLTTYLGYHTLNRALADRPAGGPWRTPGGPGGPAAAIPMAPAETSAARLAAADRLAATSGQGTAQNISMGQLGNRFARQIEDYTTVPPLGGAPAFAARRNQLADYNRQALVTADMIDPARTNLPPRAIGPTTIGERALPILNDTTNIIQNKINDLYDNPQTGLHTAFPRDAPVDPAGQHAVLDALRNSPLTNQASQRATIDRMQADLRASSNQVLDPALEQHLDASQAAVMAQPQSPQTATALQNIADQRALNRGPSFEAERTARAVNRNNDPNFVPDARIWAAVQDAKTAAMRDTAARHGAGDQFDAVEAQFGPLARQRDILSRAEDEYGNPTRMTAGQAYNSIFGTSGVGNPEQAAALMEHNPIGARQLAADEYELRMRGPVSAGERVANAETMNPKASADWTAQQRQPDTQSLYTQNDPVLQQRQADLALLLRGEGYRPTRAIPGRGATSIGGPAMTWGLPAILGGLGGGISGLPAALAGILAPTAAARFIGNRFTNPTFVRNVVNPPTVGQSINLPRILSSAVAGAVGH